MRTSADITITHRHKSNSLNFMRHLGHFIPVVLALLAASCSRIEEGVVVAKSSSVTNTSYAGLGPSFSVDVEGRDAQGKIVTRSALLPQREWLGIKIGDPFSFNGRGLLNQSSAKTNEDKTAEPPPARPKQQTRRTPKPLKPAPTPIPTPAPAPKTPTLFTFLFEHPATTPAPAETPAAPRKKRARKSSPKVKVKAQQPSATPAPTPEVSEAKYRQVQAQALEDADVRAAKQKIHTATNDEEQRRASEEYQRLLLNKMRELESSLKPRIDKEESEKSGTPPQASPTP